MKRYLFLTFAVAGIFSWAGLAFTSAAHDHPHERNAFTPDTIPWGPAPPFVRPRRAVRRARRRPDRLYR